MLMFLTMAFAMAQGGIVVLENETRGLKVQNHVGSTYIWYLYNGPTFTSLATESEAVIVSGDKTSELTVKWLKPGIYYPTVVETDQAGCTNTKAVAVTVNGLNTVWPIARISNSTVLVGNTKFIMSNSCQPTILDASSSTGEGLTYRWEPPEYLDNPNSPTPKFTPGITASYILTVTDKYGHSATEKIGIMVSEAVKAEAGENMYIAMNQTGMLDGSKSKGENLSYVWNTISGHIVEGNTTSHPVVNRAGKYYLTVTDQYGCFNKDSVQVNIYTQAIQDTINTVINISANINVLKNDIPDKGLNPFTLKIYRTPLNGIANIVGDSVINYLPDPYFVGSDSFVYSICDYLNSCDEASVLVFINDNAFFVPEAFSPNGDGINDKFEIKGIAKYKTVDVTIFNRWGNMVYQSKNYGEGEGKDGFWNGTAKSGGGPVPNGTYFYVIKLDGKENINGSIYLDR
jgi:gliding motility-associated-like protein